MKRSGESSEDLASVLPSRQLTSQSWTTLDKGEGSSPKERSTRSAVSVATTALERLEEHWHMQESRSTSQVVSMPYLRDQLLQGKRSKMDSGLTGKECKYWMWPPTIKRGW